MQVGRLNLFSQTRGAGLECCLPADQRRLSSLRLTVAPDFSHLAGVFAEDGAGSAQLYANIATPLLQTHGTELFHVAWYAHNVYSMLDTVRASVAACTRQMETARSAFDEKLVAFNALLRDHRDHRGEMVSSASDELLSLLATGVSRRAAAHISGTCHGSELTCATLAATALQRTIFCR